MEKTGLKRIGYIQNYRDFPQQIREKAGISYYDYQEFDEYIDCIWESRQSGIFCFDASGTEVTPESNQIIRFIIDTGFKTFEGNEMIFARFERKNPGALDEFGWIGVTIGTRDELIIQSVPVRNTLNALEQYTTITSYKPIARIINELAGTELSAEACASILSNSFSQAQQTGSLAIIENQYDNKKQISAFRIIGNEQIERAELYIKMDKFKADSPRTEWFGAFVLTADELKEELLSYYCFHSGNFLFQSPSHANNFYNALAQKAMRENWKWSDPTREALYSQPILKSYLEYTYYRLVDEDKELDEKSKKIIVYKGNIYFNSGLLDRLFRQIIIVGKETLLEKDVPGLGVCQWRLLSDIKAYSHNEHEIAKDFSEDEIPGIASYFQDYSQVVFDANLDIHTNDLHIFEDGVARGRLPKYAEEYERVKDDDVERERLLTRIGRDFDSAKERAKLMAERNYKLAVPQFYKETNQIQFLLPIYLGEREEAEKPQCALVLSLDKEGRRPYYRGETILTLDMAYNNTRLIAKPDVFWLNDLV